MKKLFYFGLLLLALFEIANVYFIMPMPGVSQEVNSLGLAYFLYSWRWVFRGLFLLMIVFGIVSAFRSSKWIPALSLLVVGAISYFINSQMAAEAMFRQPTQLVMAAATQNKIDVERLVIGVNHNGEAKAYPIQFLGYHHQVRDSIGGKPIMVTYCTVCRTGRVFEPVVEGKVEAFRLVGMDHFNAMFEDETTKSWWQQATGEAVAGERKGYRLPEVPSLQTTLEKWLALHPASTVMQADNTFKAEYDSMSTYERGKLTGKLTKRDTASWQKKSWVVGVADGTASKAFDWNRLQKERVIHDLGGKPVVVVLSKDNFSFVALERNSPTQLFALQNDTLVSGPSRYLFTGQSLSSGATDLRRLNAYQEYWHSWQTFHPLTTK